MRIVLSNSRGAAVVGSMLALQVIMLFISMGPLVQMSPFCSGTGIDPLASLFGGLHVLLLILLVIGASSFWFRRLRLPYLALLLIALCALPVQVWLVSRGQLHCDLP